MRLKLIGFEIYQINFALVHVPAPIHLIVH